MNWNAWESSLDYQMIQADCGGRVPSENAFILLLQEGDNMDITITLNKAKSELRIGRDRLIKLLKDFQIEVIQRIKFLMLFLKKKLVRALEGFPD